jgi:hypothetical protein
LLEGGATRIVLWQSKNERSKPTPRDLFITAYYHLLFDIFFAFAFLAYFYNLLGSDSKSIDAKPERIHSEQRERNE